MPRIWTCAQGTTASRAIIFNSAMAQVTSAQQEFTQHYPNSGWVEHNPADLWDSTLATCRAALSQAALTSGDIAAIGITNQRETTLVWDKHTGEPVYNAIVWQDRRTAPQCQKLRDLGHEQMVTDRTGLRLDPYFSGTKLSWTHSNVHGVRERAYTGELLFGTVDCFFI